MKKLLLTLHILLPISALAEQPPCNDQIPASTPFGQFTIDQPEGTVLDEKTQLMWTKCLIGQDLPGCTGPASTKNWAEALAAATTSNGNALAGFSDWRLPNVKELTTITEQQCFNPAVNLDVFPKVTSSHKLWSSSPSKDSPYSYGHLNRIDGSIAMVKRDDQLYVRLVRTAP